MFTIILKLIISWNNNRNIIKIYYYNNDDSNNNFQHFKSIKLSINNLSDYFEHIFKVVIMIKRVFNNTEIGNILNTSF